MKTYTQQKSLRKLLNKMFRSPQRESASRLQTGAVAVISTFKNKRIIDVFFEPESRYLNKI